MIPHLFFYQLAVLVLLWLCVMLHAAWPSRCATAQGTPAQPITPRRHRSKEPKPCAGLTHKPSCALCEHEATHPKLPPPVPPEPIPPTHRRPRTVDGIVNLLKIAPSHLSLEERWGCVSGEKTGVQESTKPPIVLSLLHRCTIFRIKLTMPERGNL